MTRTTLAIATLLAGTCLATAADHAIPVTDGIDRLLAPAPVGSGPGDMASPPRPFPFPGFRDDLSLSRGGSVPTPSIIAQDARPTASPCGSLCTGVAETRAGGPLGDLDLMRRIIQGGNEESAPGPQGIQPERGYHVPSADYRDLVGRWTSEAMRTATTADLPQGARRDVPADGFGAVIARSPTGVTTVPLASTERATAPAPGDPCRLVRGGSVEVVGKDPELGTLVRYGDDGPQGPGACANGTLAFLPGWVVSGWPAGGDVIARAREFGVKASDAVDRILAHAATGR